MLKLYLNLRFLTQRLTGVQRYAFEICKQLDQLVSQQYNLEVIGLLPRTPIHEHYHAYTWQQISLHPCGYGDGHLWEQTWLPWYSRDGWLLNLCNSAPLLASAQIITLHDVIFMTNLDSHKLWFKLWYRLMTRINVARAGKIITVSQVSQQEICQSFNLTPQQVLVTGNAPSLGALNADSNVFNRCGINSSGFFLMIGSNSRRKNTQLVAQLFASSPQLTQYQLVIVGGSSATLSQVELVTAPNLIYTGYIRDQELLSLYQKAQALIFPSLHEGFGIPLVEAMASATPIVAADIAVSREVCEAAALYFAPHSVFELEQQLLKLLASGLVVTQLRQAAAQRLKRYNWQSFATQILASLASLTRLKQL